VVCSADDSLEAAAAMERAIDEVFGVFSRGLDQA
jgi:hypothetical protein